MSIRAPRQALHSDSTMNASAHTYANSLCHVSALFGSALPSHPQALTPWISCLEAWGRLHRQEADIETSNEGNPGPWPIITQPASTILAKFSSTDDTRPSNAPSLPAHKALTVILYRVMLLGDEVQGSPHRTPVVAAWVAGRAYLLMLALPGAGAYGILQPAVFGLVLSNVRSWCRTSNIHRPGSVSGKSGAEDSTAVVRSSADGGGKSHGLQKRRRGGQAIGSPEADSDADSENEEVEAGRKGRRAATLALLKRGGTNGNSAAGSGSEVYACIELVKACLASVPLASHQVGRHSYLRFVVTSKGSEACLRMDATRHT